MKLSKAIKKKKKELKREAQKNGIYENFGQKEVRELKDQYIDISNYFPAMNLKRTQIESFSNWCATFTISNS